MYRDNGIYISIPTMDYLKVCEYCDSTDNVLEIEGEAYCNEYGSCGTTTYICLDCLGRVARGEITIKAGREGKGNDASD
jgi:hypothetical protein